MKTYRGTDAVYKFMKKMLEEVKWCQKMKKKHFNKDMVMTDEDTASFNKAKHCHICDKRYVSPRISALRL